MKTKRNVFVRCLLTIFLTKEKSRSTMFRKKYINLSIKGSFNTPVEQKSLNLYQKAKEGLLFGLGELPFGCAFLAKMNRQVEASCLDEVFSSLNVEKREALVKVTLGGVG